MDWQALAITFMTIIAPVTLSFFFGRRFSVADTASKYQELANKQAIQNAALIDCTDALRKGLRLVEDKVDALEAENEEKEKYIGKLIDYIDYLIDLLKKNGIIPDRPRPTRKGSQ